MGDLVTEQNVALPLAKYAAQLIRTMNDRNALRMIGFLFSGAGEQSHGHMKHVDAIRIHMQVCSQRNLLKIVTLFRYSTHFTTVS